MRRVLRPAGDVRFLGWLQRYAVSSTCSLEGRAPCTYCRSTVQLRFPLLSALEIGFVLSGKWGNLVCPMQLAKNRELSEDQHKK